MDVGAVAAPSQVGEQGLDVGALQVAPSVLMLLAAGEVEREVASTRAVLAVCGDGTERSPGQVGLAALPAEAVAEVNVHRAAEGVQSVDRVGVLKGDTIDRDLRQQVPVDRVAERFVEADPVHVHGQPLRCALERGGLETVVEQRWLKRITGRAVELQAGYVGIKCIQQVRRSSEVEVRPAQRGAAGRKAGVFLPYVRERRRAHDDLLSRSADSCDGDALSVADTDRQGYREHRERSRSRDASLASRRRLSMTLQGDEAAGFAFRYVRLGDCSPRAATASAMMP